MTTLRYTIVETPIGRVLLARRERGLAALEFVRAADVRKALASIEPGGAHVEDRAALGAGRRWRFDLALEARGTPFQMAVWRELREIPYGETRTYGQIARAVGKPEAVRAVGAANGRNPICIVVPCHRVIGKDGGLTGFTAGLKRKRFLLDLEARVRGADAAGTAAAR
jgi:methylated-DNA-[protein]-cysteine S-methyltransferase